MKTNIILFSLISLLFFSPRMKAQPNTAKHDFTHKENGWYHRWGEYGTVNMSREYKVFTPLL